MKPRVDVTVTHGRIETAERRKSENTITGVEGSFKGIVVRLSMSSSRYGGNGRHLFGKEIVSINF